MSKFIALRSRRRVSGTRSRADYGHPESSGNLRLTKVECEQGGCRAGPYRGSKM